MGDFTPEKLAQLWPSELATALASPEARTQLPRIALDDRYDAPVRRLAIYIASNEQLCIEAMESDSTVARRAAIGSFARIMGKKSRRPLAWKAIGGTDGFVGLVHRLSTKEVSRLVTAISGRCRKLLGKEDASEVFDDAVLRLLRTSGDTSRTLLPRLWPLLSTTSADAVREILPEMIKSVPTKIYRLAYTHPNTMRAACLSYMKSLYTDAEEVEHLSSLTVCLKDLILSRVPFDWPEAGGSQQGDPGLRFALALLRAYASLIERVPDLASYKDILYPRSATLHEIGALCFDKIGPRDVPALEEFARAITTICRLSSDTTTLFTTSQIPKSSFLRTPVRAWSLDPNERTASLLSSIAFYIPPDSLPPLGPYSAIAPFLDQVPRSQRFSLLRLLCSSTASPLEIDAEKWPPTDDPDLRRSRSIKWDAKILLTFDRESARKAYQASVSVLGNQDALSGNHGYHYRTAMFDGFRRDIEGTIMGAYLRGDESIINQLRTFTTKESAADERAKFLKLTLHTAALFDTDTVFMDTLVWAFGRFTKDVKPREMIMVTLSGSTLCTEVIVGVGRGWYVDKDTLGSPEKLELLAQRCERGNAILRIVVAALHKAISEPDFRSTEWERLYKLITRIFHTRAEAFGRLGCPQALLGPCLESVLAILLEAERIELLEASAKLSNYYCGSIRSLLDETPAGRRSAPVLIGVLDGFSEKRDKLYQETRIKECAAVATLPAGVPRGLPIQDLAFDLYMPGMRTKGHRSPFIEGRLYDILFSPHEVLQTKISAEQEEYCGNTIDSFNSALDIWLQGTGSTTASIDRLVALAKHLRDISPDGDLRGLLVSRTSSARLLEYERGMRGCFGDIWPRVPDGGEGCNPLIYWPADPLKHQLLMERQTLIAKRVLEWPWDEGANRTRDLFEMARAYRTILPGMVRKAVALAAFSFLRQTEPFNAHLHLEHFEVADLKYVLHGDFLDEAQNDELKPKQVTPYLAAVSGDVNLKPLIEFVSVVTHEQHLAQIDGLKAGKGQALNLVASLCKALQLSDRPQLAIRPSLDAIKHPAASSRARHILGPRLLGILPPAQVDSLYDQLFEWIVAKHASEDFDIKVSVFKTVTEMLRLPYLSRDATFSRLTQLGELSGHIDIQHGICKWVLQDLTKSTEPISDATWSLVDSFVTMANGIVEGVSFTEEKWHAFEDGTAELPEVESNQRIKASLLGMKPEDAPDLSYTYAKRVIAPLALNTTINKRRYISTFLKASGIELDTPLQVTQGVSVEDVQDWIPGLPLSLLDIFESQATAHVLDSQFARWKSDLSRHNERWNDTPGGKQLSHIEQGMASTTAFTTLVSALFNEGLQPSDEHLISVKSMQDLLVSVGTKLLQNPRSIAGHHPLEHIRTLLTTLGPNVAQRAEWSIRARPVIERIAAAYESLVLESGPAIKPHRLEIAILLLPFPSHPPFSEKADSCAVFAHALADLITSLVDEDPDVYHVHLPLLMKLAEQNYFLAQDIFPVARALTSLTEGGLRVRVIRHQWAHRLVTAWSGSLTELEKTELIEMWKQDESPLISALGYAHLLS